MTKKSFKLGDSVMVKPDVIDPDFNINIGGWQGRISEINQQDNLALITWDSLTLEQMPSGIIDQSKEEGLDWTKMFLDLEEVELSTARDTLEEVKEIVALLENKFDWSLLGEEGRRIQAVLADADDDWSAFEAWEEHLGKVLKFPFEAEVSESQGRGPLRLGETVTVLGLEGSKDLKDLYGILVSLRHEQQRYLFPLCDLEVRDQRSSNYQPVKDYAIWFANR